MYVSMNPKGETGKVIHISQNDTNREVEFIPFDQNGLTPLTDGQLTARINSIKGNTVSFNQLVQNGNFADTSNWNRASLAAYSASNNIYSWTGNAQYNGIYQALNWISGHKYYFTIDVYGTNTSNRYRLQVNGTDKEVYGYYINAWETVKGIYDCSVSRSGNFFICDLASSSWVEIKAKCAMVFDLTLMGIDNLTTTAEVEAWLSSHIGDLPYFDYTQGTLIPFNGSGLKTTGKNLVYKIIEKVNISSNGELFTDEQELYDIAVASVVAGNKYIITPHAPVQIMGYFTVVPVVGNRTYNNSRITNGADIFTAEITGYVAFRLERTKYEYAQLEIGVTRTSYEEYVSNTTDLLISQYFPTGMKSAGSVYDELTESKAITRTNKIVFTSKDGWTTRTTGSGWVLFENNMGSSIKDVGQPSEATIKNNLFNWNLTLNNNNSIRQLITVIAIRKDDITSLDAWGAYLSSNPLEIHYQLPTPTETDISLDLTYPVWNGGTEQILPVNESVPTTAPIKANITYPDRTEDTEFLYKQTSFEWIYKSWAFVCKNITQALSVVGNALKGTIPGTMTSESGKFPLKVKMTDNDGVCFSEKIDLYVERKP